MGLNPKVALILSSRELAINRGTQQGIRRGEVFAILSPLGFERGRVRVSEVYSRFAICTTYRLVAIPHEINVRCGDTLSPVVLIRPVRTQL